MAKIKIKKTRSEINRPGDQKKTLLALGLKKTLSWIQGVSDV